MKKFVFLILLAVMPWTLGLNAQVVTTNPTPLQEDSPGVEIFFHADQGNQGLMNSPQSESIYAHTGVEVVDANGVTTSWKYAPTWGDNDAKYKLSYVSPNLWKLYIGNIREYYGVAQTETVKKLCFVFRNANKTKEGKGVGNTDIFVDVLDKGFQLSFTHSASGNIINAATGSVTFTATTTEPGDLSISINGTQIAAQSNVTQLTATKTFDAPGQYNVECTAKKGAVTKTESISMLYVANSNPAADKTIPPMGCTKNADGSYTFCLAAPQKQNAVVVGSWNNYQPSLSGVMEYVDRMIEGVPFRYFKATIPASEIKAPFSYYYTVDTKKNVGDPYARLVLDPDNDGYIPAEVYPNLPEYPTGKVPAGTYLAYYADNMLDYNWSNTSFQGVDKTDLVIYEMLFRDFTGTEGKADGNGTVRKAMEKISYLKNLGVNAVELLPINEFNGNNSWGYNPNYYFAIDKAYGTPQDYKAFIDACHNAGIAVILDVVFNQSDWQHPWYQLYDVGSNPFYNATAPHAYSVLNDWNQGYPLVEEQWNDMLKFWLREYKVDGFRFDLVKGLGNNDSYANNGDNATNAYNASRVARMKRLHEAVRSVKPDAYFINENLAGTQEENEMAADGELNWSNLNYAGCQYAMGFESGSSLNAMNAAKAGRTPGSTVAYLESHDEERLAYKQKTWGQPQIKGNNALACQRLGSAAAQMILCPGAHMIWMFSEMGNSQTTKSNNGSNNTSPKIVNWNLLNNPDNKGLMECYSQLIRIRTSNPDLFPAVKDFANNCSGWEAGRTIIAKTADKELYCIINPDVAKSATIYTNFRSSNNSDYYVSSKSYGSNPTFDAVSKTVTVEPGCYAVVSTRNISEVDDIEDDLSHLLIFGGRGTLTVSGASSTTYVYGLDGTLRATISHDDTVSLPSGVYVARNGERTVKVLVK